MKINKYLISLYLKYFTIIFLSLNIFNVVIEVIFSDKLPVYTNIKILYLFYTFIYSINSTLGIVVIFTFLILLRVITNNSEFIALLSLGYNKKHIMKPFIMISCILIALSWSMNFTNLAYAEDKKEALKNNQDSQKLQKDIFLKQNNTYVYFHSLSPLQKIAKKVKIFIFDNDLKLQKIHYANQAVFKDNFWVLHNVKTLTYTKSSDFSNTKITTKTEQTKKVLEGFLPNIIQTIYEKSINYSIPDALALISLLDEQNMNTNKARSTIYSNIIFPMFPLFLIIIIFSFTPVSSRLSNINTFQLKAFTGTLSVYGLLSMFRHLSYFASGWNTEIFSLVPIVILSLYTIHRYITLGSHTNES